MSYLFVFLCVCCCFVLVLSLNWPLALEFSTSIKNLTELLLALVVWLASFWKIFLRHPIIKIFEIWGYRCHTQLHFLSEIRETSTPQIKINLVKSIKIHWKYRWFNQCYCLIQPPHPSVSWTVIRWFVNKWIKYIIIELQKYMDLFL